MTHGQRDTLREVDWPSLCPWLILVAALRLDLAVGCWLLSTVGLSRRRPGSLAWEFP